MHHGMNILPRNGLYGAHRPALLHSFATSGDEA
jgi:hypothetical protein